MNDQDVLPTIIQGGMGVAVSGWELANAVCRTGELGVVSGTALDVVCARRLMSGDPGGHMRRALAAFPIPAMALRVMKQYYIHGGKADDAAFRTVPRFTVSPGRPAGADCGGHLLRGLAGQAGALGTCGDQLPAQDRDPPALRPPRGHARRRRLRPDRRGQPCPPRASSAPSPAARTSRSPCARGMRSDDGRSAALSPTELLGEAGRGLAAQVPRHRRLGGPR